MKTENDIINLVVRIETLFLTVVNTEYEKMPVTSAQRRLLNNASELNYLVNRLSEIYKDDAPHAPISKVNNAKLRFYYQAMLSIADLQPGFMYSIIEGPEENRIHAQEYLYYVYVIGQWIGNSRIQPNDDYFIAANLADYEIAGSRFKSTPYINDIFSYRDTLEAILKFTPYWSDVVSA